MSVRPKLTGPDVAAKWLMTPLGFGHGDLTYERLSGALPSGLAID